MLKKPREWEKFIILFFLLRNCISVFHCGYLRWKWANVQEAEGLLPVLEYIFFVYNKSNFAWQELFKIFNCFSFPTCCLLCLVIWFLLLFISHNFFQAYYKMIRVIQIILSYIMSYKLLILTSFLHSYQLSYALITEVQKRIIMLYSETKCLSEYLKIGNVKVFPLMLFY